MQHGGVIMKHFSWVGLFACVYASSTLTVSPESNSVHPLDFAGSLLDTASGGVNAISIICGLFFLCSGLYHYSLYRKDPVNVRISTPVVMVLCSVLLFCLPYVGLLSGS